MPEIEQWDLEIQHIKGIDNALASILSRNPPFCQSPNATNPRQRDQMMVHAINLNIDSSVKRELKNLAILQNTDPRQLAIKQGLTTNQTMGKIYMINNHVSFCKGDEEGRNWKAMLPECLKQKVMLFVHTSLGHLGGDKCYTEIEGNFYFRGLGRKHGKFIAICDLCQRTKHTNRGYGVAERHHLPQRPRELWAVDLYGNLPTSRSNVRYIFVYYDVFSKYAKMYPLKSATTKACLTGY